MERLNSGSYAMAKSLLLTTVTAGLLACGGNTQQAKDADAGGHKGHQMAAPGAGYADSVNSGLIAVDTLKGSPQRVAMNTVGNTHVHITYNAPGVKDRVIWGGLVAYDKVWATGAHQATTVQTDNPITIDGKLIPAGKYALFTIPGRESWVVILNSRHDQHLADEYNEQEDVLRITVNPESNSMVQRLTYSVNTTGDTTGEIVIAWEKLKLVVPFSAE